MRRREPTAGISAGVDQPSLPLAVAPVQPRLAMELSTPCAAAFDSDEWLFTVDWEGSRALLVSDGDGGARLQGATGSLDTRFPEVVAAGLRLGPGPAVLDGTVCILDTLGRPALEVLAERAATGASKPRAVFLATDLLRRGALDLRRRPLAERLEQLAATVGGDPTIQAPEHVAGNGTALADAAAERGLSAVLARRCESGYHAGVASPDRLRIALSGRREHLVAGVSRRGEHLHAVLADWDTGGLNHVATVPVERRTWRRVLESAETSEGTPAVVAGAGPGVRWLRPRLVATVDPALTAPDGSVRRWRLVALRDDVDPGRCAGRPPVAPPTASAPGPRRAFSPTVLSALPLDGAA